MIDAPGIRNLNKKPVFEDSAGQDANSSTMNHAPYDTQKSEQLRLIVEYREKIE